MKKAIILVIAVALLVTSCFALAACNNDEAVVKVIDIKLTEEEYAFAVAKTNTTLLEQVNSFLAEIKADGTFTAIVEKYFNNGTPTAVVSATEDANKDQLIVATNAAFEPFEYLDGNNFYGVDMEIAAALAAKLNKELVIKNIEFDAVVTSVENGYADIGMAGLTITEEREKVVTFTDSYYDASQMLIVKASDTTFDNCKNTADVEAILNAKTSDTKVAVQKGTTGQFYVEGDEDWGFDGYPVTCVPYSNGALAVQAMINGNVDFVIIDEAPAFAISTAMNKIN